MLLTGYVNSDCARYTLCAIAATDILHTLLDVHGYSVPPMTINITLCEVHSALCAYNNLLIQNALIMRYHSLHSIPATSL
jgi:hypothetical protein